MRHRSLVKVLASSAAIIMASMSFAACGSGSQTTTDANGKPIVRISIKRIGNDVKLKDTAWSKDLEAACNCSIEWTEISDNVWEQQKSAKLVAGDLPDISMSMFDPSDISRYSSSFEDLSSHLKQMPNVQAFFKARPTARKMAADGSHIYLLPSDRGKGYRVSVTHMMINKQWLDKLGLSMPTTWDELENVLKAFKTRDPNGNGKADEVPMSLYRFGFDPTTPFGLSSSLVLLNSTGLTTAFMGSSAASQGYYVKDGKVGSYLTSDNLKRVIAYLHKLMAEGLIPKDAFTKDSSQYDTQKINDGKTALTGFSFGWASTTDFGKLGDQYTAVPPLKESASTPSSDVTWDYSQDFTEFAYALAVSAKATNKDAIYKIINTMYSEKNSVQQYFGSIPQYLSNDGNHTYTVSDKAYEKYGDTHGVTAQDRFAGWIPDNVTINNDTNAEGVTKTNEAYKAALNNVDPVKDVIPIYVRPSGNDMDTLSNNDTTIYNFVNNQLAKWVQDGGIDSEWPSYIKKIEDPSLGLNKNIAIWQKYYNSFTK